MVVDKSFVRSGIQPDGGLRQILTFRGRVGLQFAFKAGPGFGLHRN